MPGAPTSLRNGSGRALGSRDGRGIHKQTSEASREARERVNRLKRLAQAAGSSGWLKRLAHGADTNGFGSSGWLKRLAHGADYSGQTQTGGRGAGRRWGAQKANALEVGV